MLEFVEHQKTPIKQAKIKELPRIIIVGGGAGGLELATALGNSLGKKGLAKITLVDTNLTHTWKPLWHEVAAGTLTSGQNELNYIVHAYRNFFSFQLGRFISLDRKTKKITLDEVNNQFSEQVLPKRTLSYDTLIIAVGSLSHDFNVPGVKEYCYSLDSISDCQNFQQKFLSHLMQLQEQIESKLTIAIIGGGATGVELAAELQFAYQQAIKYKNKTNKNFSQIEITIIESAPKLVPALAEKISIATKSELERRGIRVLTNEQVTGVDEKHVYLKNKVILAADIKIWAAGIKAPEFLSTLDLETNAKNQLVVNNTLQTTRDKNIFAFGDCASCTPKNSKKPAPPTAQVAHQEADLLAESLTRYVKGKSLLPYKFHNYGALITLGETNAFGNLMGKVIGNLMIEGKIALLAYNLLHRKHQAALYGYWRVFLLMLSQLLIKPFQPRLKLH